MDDATLDQFAGGEGTDEDPDGEAASPADDGDAPTGDADAPADDGTADEANPSAETAAAPASGAAPDEDAGAGTVGTDEVPPATSTYAWSAEGGDCGVCGGTVARRWRQDGALVCPDCKDWE